MTHYKNYEHFINMIFCIIRDHMKADIEFDPDDFATHGQISGTER